MLGKRWTAVLIFVVTLAAFSGAVRNSFLAWDDNINIYNNPHIRGLTLENLRWIVTDTTYVRRYIPLAWLVWAIQYQLLGFDPWSWHLVDVILHALNAVLVFLLLEHIARLAFAKPDLDLQKLRWSAAIGALFWALHPLRTEVVAWASGRLYEQATTFLLVSLLCYLRACETVRFRKSLLLFSIVSFLSSILTYPVGLFCVFLYPLLDVYPLRRVSETREFQSAKLRALLLEKLPFCGTAGLMLFLTVYARTQASGIWAAPATLQDFGILSRCMQGFYVWSCYLWRTLLPINLSPLYTNLFSFRPLGITFILSFSLVVGASLWLFHQRRRWPGVLAAWLAYLVILVPMLGFTEHPHVANDRYSFLPAIAISSCLTAILQITPWFRMGCVACALWSAVLAGLSVSHGMVWRNSETLFKHMIVQLGSDPYSEVIHFRLGMFYENQAKAREAVEQYKICLASDPGDLKVLVKLASLLTLCEEKDVRNGMQAVVYARRASELTANSDPQKLTLLASALAESGRGSEAIDVLLKAQELAKANGNEGFVTNSSKLMEFYRAGKTARDYMASTK